MKYYIFLSDDDYIEYMMEMFQERLNFSYNSPVLYDGCGLIYDKIDNTITQNSVLFIYGELRGHFPDLERLSENWLWDKCNEIKEYTKNFISDNFTVKVVDDIVGIRLLLDEISNIQKRKFDLDNLIIEIL